MAYSPDAKCLAAATAAAKGALTQDEILAAFQQLSDRKARLEAEGRLTGQSARVKIFAQQEGERAKIAAAMRRRHAALNALVRVRQDAAIDGYLRAGMKPQKALLAILEGSQRGVQNARKSVAATQAAFTRRFAGAMMGEMQAEKPHLVALLGDKKLDADVVREMVELRKDGKPGVTGNEDAIWLAKTFAKYAELARSDLNRLGASIGKLDGWAGTQTHDDVKLIQAGKDAWVGFVVSKLDLARTFPEGLSGPEAARALGEIYDTIITGFSKPLTPAERGQRVSPANMAKALGAHRVLHFRDADAALAYQTEFGYGNTIAGMFAHLRHAARAAGAMEALGPNPEVMFTALADSLKRRVKEDATLAPGDKAKQVQAINIQAGALRQALDIATGVATRPVSVTAAKIGSDIRALQSMAKLGGAVLSSVSDTISAAAAGQFRGNSFLGSLARQLGGIMAGRPKGEQAEISFILGEGFDGLIGHIISPYVAHDAPIGALSGLQQQFFRWNGLNWWTDVNRATAARVVAAEMGMRAKAAYGDLPMAFRHVLEMNGIDATRWDIIRKARLRQANGRDYVTPDRIQELPDAAFRPLVAERLARIKPTDKARAEKEARIFADARRDVELSLLRFIADETDYAVIQTDNKTRRYMTLGQRPGTVAGEAMRFIMQFKGFPIAFTERVLGRSLYGYGAGRKLEQAAHIGAILAGLTVAGYVAMTLKDMAKGYWPPRDPGDPRTWLAAAQQGGAWGIYGDFLFSKVNRFGGGLTETAIGPTLGSVADLAEIGLGARDFAIDIASGEEGRFAGSQALGWAIGNTPFANLYYVKPALDYLFLDSLREALSPGSLRRRERKRRTEYGQEAVRPTRAPLDPLGVAPAF